MVIAPPTRSVVAGHPPAAGGFHREVCHLRSGRYLAPWVPGVAWVGMIVMHKPYIYIIQLQSGLCNNCNLEYVTMCNHNDYND